jgi:D-aminoacyl-tRNA deacylase
MFLSRHRAESGIPSLTAHFPGNFGSADFGGNPGEIARYSPSLLKNYLVELNSLRNEIEESYKITLEATHHGPTSLRSTVMFIELGTTEKQWEDVKAAKPIAKALVAALDSNKHYEKCAIGIGGTHYPEKLNKRLLYSDLALGPIIPKHALEHFSKAILDQMLAKGDQKISMALVDNNGLGKYKQDVMNVLEESDLEMVNA